LLASDLNFIKRHSKKLQMQGAQGLRREAYWQVR
jgi:hypothetical protein